jgi:alkanesulfonate monooxygenase SsuD/methylene tetrahydromethanopterin reductase-like flavin-dependent oxidoreductase (luciferase family)
MAHALRFGIITIQDQPWLTMVRQWKQIEALGYDSLWVADHFVDPFCPETDWFDGWALLAALATQTTKIQIGTLVTNFIYRNPAIIAKQALTVDHISQGRLILGLGATTEIDPSHLMTGVEVWTTSERVQRFREVVEIVDTMLRHETTTYQGRYYQITNALMHPAPIQKPRPPFTIAAAGKTTLRIAAQYADTWNTYGEPDQSFQKLDMLHQRSELLDQYCEEIGRNPGEITRSFLVGFTEDTPFVSIDAFYDFVGCYREIGISEFIFYYDRPGMSPDKHLKPDMLERIATEAIPKLRKVQADSN